MKRTSAILLFILVTAFVSVNDDNIKLDGKIDKAEWAAAKEYELSSGGRLYILQKDEIVYIGIKGNAPGWAHVYLYWNDSIKILHASAALGYQLYTSAKDHWKLQKKFNWEVREFAYDDKLIQKQAAYYLKNGWCANNNNTGDKTSLEYKIDLKRFGKAEVRFAALFTPDARSLSYFPPGLNDNTLLEKLVSGNDPDSLRFKPAVWTKIK